jgi:uncharacterized BrkB/YihY/UPF0761 family membrane protein
LWKNTIGPQIEPKVLPHVFDGIDQTVQHVFASSSAGSLVVVGWIGETLIFGAYVRSVANFRTSVGSLEVFIFLATYFYIASIVLLVATELDELVREDLQRPPSRRKLLPLVACVIRGEP